MAAVWKLLVLIAVLLMPLGMAPATAAVAHHHTAAGMPMGHCPGQAPRHDMKGGIAECTMACASTLPAADVAAHEPLTIAGEPDHQEVGQRLHGLHPDTATPPPKRT